MVTLLDRKFLGGGKMLDRKRSVLFLSVMALLMLGFSWNTAALPSDVCATIDQFQVEKQENFRAYLILVQCGRVSPTQPQNLLSPDQELMSNVLGDTLGGVDQDIILGGEGTSPHVTQSETQVWAEGNTVVSTYNDSRTAG